jgi:hypothetical protein
MTDPLLMGSTSTAAVEQRDPGVPLAAAVHDLYRACHLPVPSVVVAPSAAEFVHIVLALGRDWWPPLSLLLTLILCALATLGLGAFALHEVLEEGLTRSTAIYLALAAYVSFTLAAMTAYPVSRRRSAWIFAPEVILGLAVPAALAAGVGFAFGGGAVAIAAASLGSAAAATVHLLLAPAAPIGKRWAMRQAYRVPIPFRRVRPLHNVFGTRLRAARDGLPEASSRRRSSPTPARRERPDAAARLEAEGLRLGEMDWPALRPMFGAGSRQTETYLLEHALERVGGAQDLPHLLRAAWTLHRLTDAVTLLEGVAVVLPADAPLEPVPSSYPARAWRRSGRSPYREVLAVLQNGLWPGLGVDVAWSDSLADRLLAKNICKMPDAGLRHAAIRAMGLDRFVAAARLPPVQKDSAGELYLVGPPLDPLAFVRVMDASPGPDGTAPRHWLSVPPHVATAREAVAWTFGLAEQDYAPAAET